MLTLDEAYAVALDLVPAVRTEEVPLDEAWGRVLAAPVHARVSVPPFARALMDGFAVRSGDATADAVLSVIATVYAGDDETAVPVLPGTAVRVTTGAPLPPGADAVIRFEWTESAGNGAIRVLRAVSPGESVQPAGEDGEAGDCLLTPGTRLDGPQLAVCRTFGIGRVKVVVPPAVAVLVTGSELVDDPEQSLRPGQIYAANDLIIAGGLRAEGLVPAAVEFLPDDEATVMERISHYADRAGVLVTTGGVSAGDRDYVRLALHKLGAEIRAEGVWMRPGTPVILARLGETAVFGLSGNPAACWIQFEVLVLPALRRALGRPDPGFSLQGVLSHAVTLKRTRHTRILRARLSAASGTLYVDAQLSQSSAVVSSLAQSDCLIRVDGGHAPAGSVVPMRLLSNCHSGR